MLYLLPLDEQNEPKTDCNVPDWGHFLQQEVDKNNIKDIEGLLFYRLGKEKTITAKGKDRAVQLYPFSHSRASLRVLPFLCLVGRKAVHGCLWYYCFCVPLASFCRKCPQSGTLQSVFGLFCLSSGKRFNIIWSIPWYDFFVRPLRCKSCDFFLGCDGSHFSNSSFWNLLLLPRYSLSSRLWSSTFWSIFFSLSKRCVWCLF